MNIHSTVSSLTAFNGKATRCPEAGCPESFDDSSLVFVHFITSHPFSYVRLKKRGADALCDAVPGADKSCVVRRMRVVVDDAGGGGGKKSSEKIASAVTTTKNVDVSAANDDDGSADEISVVDEEIDLEIVKAYETLTMNGRRRQSVDMEDVSQCSERETAPNCLSNSPKIDRFCSKFASSTPSNVVVGGLTRRSPSPNVDEINTAAVSPKMNETNKNLDVKNNDIDNEVDDRENNSTSFQDNQSLEYSKSSPQKRRRSDCARSNRSRSQSNSSARSASPSHRESRRQRSRSASTPPKRSRRSASRCSSASKAASGSRRSASSRPPRARRRSSRSTSRASSSNNVKRRRRRSPSTSSSSRSSVDRSSGSASRRRTTRHPSNRKSNFSGEEISVPCLICPKMFSSPDEAYNHDIDAHGNFGRFPCILCTKFVACDPNKLQLHIETQHPARRRILKLACPFCHHNFSLWGQYNNHLEWEYSVRRRRVYDEIWHRSSLQCSLCGAEVGAVDRRDFENHARDCRALKDNGSGRQEQPQPCCTRRHAERRGCIHFRTFCKKYPGCSGAVCDFAHPTCKFDPTCRTKNCEWFHTATPRERCSMCGKNASGSSHDQSL